MSVKHRENVVVSIKQGVVKVESLDTGPVTHQYDLPNGITAEEHFPATGNQGNYHLSLLKPVSEPDQVDIVEQMLIEELRGLSRVWPFAGGCLLSIEKVHREASSEFSSNAKDVKAKLLEKEDKKEVSTVHRFVISVSGTYKRLPLKHAIEIRDACLTDIFLEMLLDYYYMARTEQGTWYVDFYKVREVLKKLLKEQGLDKKEIGITKSDWETFGEILNNHDLRHAPVKCSLSDPLSRPASRAEKVTISQLSRKWIRAYLDHEGIAL